MKNGFWGKSIGGLTLIAIGVVFFLYQSDYIDFDLAYIISNFWPVVLIVIGLRGLFAGAKFNEGYMGSFIWSLVMISIGLVFLNNNFGWIPNFGFAELIKFAIPVVLILFGIRMLLKPRSSSSNRDFETNSNSNPESEPYTPKDWKPYSNLDAELDNSNQATGNTSRAQDSTYSDTIHSAPHMNGSERKQYDAKPEWKQRKEEWKEEMKQRKREWKHDWKQWRHEQHYGSCGHSYGNGVDNRHSFIGDVRLGREYWELRPLNISHFVGDTEIDLTRANIPYGETTINISAFVGDVKIFVPNDLQLDVSVRASAFIGDMSVFDRWEGGLFRNMKAESPHYNEAEKRIKVNVSTFIGDVRVKRVG